MVQTASRKEAYAEIFIKNGWKLKKRQPNNPIGFFIHCPILNFEKKILIRQIFDEVRKISKFGWFDMFLGSTLGIGTKIILSKIDGFLKGWILNITPLKNSIDFHYAPLTYSL